MGHGWCGELGFVFFFFSVFFPLIFSFAKKKLEHPNKNFSPHLFCYTCPSNKLSPPPDFLNLKANRGGGVSKVFLCYRKVWAIISCFLIFAVFFFVISSFWYFCIFCPKKIFLDEFILAPLVFAKNCGG